CASVDAQLDLEREPLGGHTAIDDGGVRVGKADVGEERYQLADYPAQDFSRQDVADAEVRAVAEGADVLGVAADIESRGIGVKVRIVIRGAHGNVHHHAAVQRHPVDHAVLDHEAMPEIAERVDAQTLLDGAVEQFG